MKIDKQTVDTLLPFICEAGDIDASTILSSSRLNKATVCRFIVFRYLYEDLIWTTTRIGMAFGRNHATVIHGIRKAKDFISLPSYDKERAIHDDFMERIMIHENEN